VHGCGPSTQEAEAGGSLEPRSSPGPQNSSHLLTPLLDPSTTHNFVELVNVENV
jgi:hypothetical protein